MISQQSNRRFGNALASSREQLARFPFWMRVIVFLLIVGAVILVNDDNYVTAVAISVATYAMLGLGLNIVVGYAGLLDLGYAAFFAIGAYTSALLMTQGHWNFFATLPLAVLFAGTAGARLAAACHLPVPVLAFRHFGGTVRTKIGFGGDCGRTRGSTPSFTLAVWGSGVRAPQLHS